MARAKKRTRRPGRAAGSAGGRRSAPKRKAAGAGLHLVARAGEIPEGAAKAVRVGRREIAVFHVADSFHALDNFCTHAGRSVSLADAARCGEDILCPLHGWKFDIVEGKCSMVPDARVRTYEVEMHGDEIWVRV